jgi:hypothetical protein
MASTICSSRIVVIGERLMLNCIYHPVEGMKVVEQEEYDDLIESGVWFDSPDKAKELRENYEEKLSSNAQRKRRVRKSAASESGTNGGKDSSTESGNEEV